MSKKNKKLIIVLVLILTLLATGLGNYTYAKYKSKVTGEGQLEVAKWSFKVNGNSEQMETIQLKDTVNESVLAKGKVAPGTNGEFTLNIDASEAEVGINYQIEFRDEKNKPDNLVFIYGGQKYKNLQEINGKLKGDILQSDVNKVRKVTIQWEWSYETGFGEEIELNDQKDTQNGMEMLNYTFSVIVTGTQLAI